ncbi:dTMP kinase [Geofilum rhodophaeum]|uniref:dTMP kinase n=1 Tax=Geofilum rhodophaeum TaxID=1965019 RepID=UPI000B5251FD|nr:dTMP kinase [Geofilum rhodophaeum]
MQGKIITIEGLDGAGKSTQIELLTRHLTRQGHKHRFIHFPMLNQGHYGSLIAQYLRGEFGSLEAVHPQLVALLFAEDRNEHKATLQQWLNDGYTIVMDRYVNSNIAFQCAKTPDPQQKQQLKEWILHFEFEHNQLPQPSASFFLNVPFASIRASLSNQRTGADRDYLNGKTDIHEASLQLQQNVLTEYLTLLTEQPNLFEIPCFGPNHQWLPPQVIHESIVKKIEG